MDFILICPAQCWQSQQSWPNCKHPCDVSHFLCPQTISTTAKWIVMLQLFLCWTASRTHTAHTHICFTYKFTRCTFCWIIHRHVWIRTVVVHVAGKRPRLWTVATNGPIICLPCDIGEWRATVERHQQGKLPIHPLISLAVLSEESSNGDAEGSWQRRSWILLTKYLFHTHRVL
jgi:hypothetical protein